MACREAAEDLPGPPKFWDEEIAKSSTISLCHFLLLEAANMAQTKATKKFEKKHLKDTLKRRKEYAKVKQKIHLKEKRKARRAQENGAVDNNAEAGAEDRKDANGNKFADMSVDDFFAGGFEIPEQKKNKRSKADQKLGKRKRAEAEDGNGPDSNEELADGVPLDASDDEDDSDFGDHKQQLEALAENDPEFYKHLKENEPELLDFEDDADLAGIQLSESEEETPKSKKQKTGKKKQEDEDEDASAGNEVTMAMVEKWHSLMTEKHSLRQMREVVLAFRAAVRSNDADDKEFRYSISNADGRPCCSTFIRP